MFKPTPCQEIKLLNVAVVVKREDLNHPVIQGNKWWKLKYNIDAAINQHADTLITFGGAYSNHLLATAFAAKEQGLASVGVVRGDELKDNQAVWSETLHQCQQLGMQLMFVNREHYREKQYSQPVSAWLSNTPQAYVVPEGGSNQLAAQGMADWVQELAKQVVNEPTHIICPVGTGGTLAGIIVGVSQQGWSTQVLGVAVHKGMTSVKDNIKGWSQASKGSVSWQLLDEYHGGGYAKRTEEMNRFALAFTQQNNIPLDKIYNIKSFYGLAQLIKNGQITAQDRPLIIHTGGLQGGLA